MSAISETVTPAPGPTRMRTFGVPQCAVVLGALMTLTAFCGRWGWLWELSTHFRVQYFWLLTIAACILAACRRPGWAMIATPFALANLAIIVPIYFPSGEPAVHGTPVRALLLNVYWHNDQFDKVLGWIRQERPDFFLVLEVTPAWIGALEELEGDYPYSRKAPQRLSGGIAFYSRLPTASIDFKYAGGMPSIVAHLAPDTGPFTVIGAHPSSPRSASEFARRNLELDALAELVLFQRGPRIVLGDLNTTSWSPNFQDLLEVTGLVDSRQGFGVEPTWPALPLPLRIPIDHCLVTREVSVTRRRVGPAVGSDHRGVVIELQIAAATSNSVSSPSD